MSVPFFIPEEIQSFDEQFERSITNLQPMYLARCKGIEIAKSTELEIFVAAYLLMNVLLMDRLNRRILKLVYIDSPRTGNMYAVLNTLRSLFNSDFSSLEKISLWKEMVEKSVSLSVPSIDRIRTGIEFIHGSGVLNDSQDSKRADVFLGMRAAAKADTPYTISDIDPFRIKLASLNHSKDVFTPELFLGGTSTLVRSDVNPFFLGIEVDIAQPGWLDEWLKNAEPIVTSKMYSVKR